MTKPAVDTDAAKVLLEADGYVLNGDGLYEKDGETLTLRLYYYASRSLGTLALLMMQTWRRNVLVGGGW